MIKKEFWYWKFSQEIFFLSLYNFTHLSFTLFGFFVLVYSSIVRFSSLLFTFFLFFFLDFFFFLLTHREAIIWFLFISRFSTFFLFYFCYVKQNGILIFTLSSYHFSDAVAEVSAKLTKKNILLNKFAKIEERQCETWVKERKPTECERIH